MKGLALLQELGTVNYGVENSVVMTITKKGNVIPVLN
jgi:hypothetical protein